MTSRYMSSKSLIPAPAPAKPAPALLYRLRRAYGSRVYLPDAADARDEAIDVFARVVEVEARAVRGGDAELSHQRLAAMVPGANADTVEVEELRHVVRMGVVEVEADDAGAP